MPPFRRRDSGAAGSVPHRRPAILKSPLIPLWRSTPSKATGRLTVLFGPFRGSGALGHALQLHLRSALIRDLALGVSKSPDTPTRRWPTEINRPVKYDQRDFFKGSAFLHTRDWPPLFILFHILIPKDVSNHLFIHTSPIPVLVLFFLSSSHNPRRSPSPSLSTFL